jgi:hypothetical protein
MGQRKGASCPNNNNNNTTTTTNNNNNNNNNKQNGAPGTHNAGAATQRERDRGRESSRGRLF